MRSRVVGLGLLAGVLALSAITSASAEMFTCHDRPGQVLAVYNGSPSTYGSRSYSRHYSSNYSAQSYRRSYQRHATIFAASRHYWNDRSRW
jgi:hypothetical protein